MERRVIRLGRSFLLLAVAVRAAPAAASFVTLESGQVRPLALSPDGSQLFAVTTPDDRLEIFSVGSDGLTHTGSVPVGLEPVAVAARTNGEVWVVNQLSDSVSIVDVASAPPHVLRTLLVGDEPRDIVFAGPKDSNNFFLRAFITTAHRGQNSGVPFTDLITPGIGERRRARQPERRRHAADRGPGRRRATAPGQLGHEVAGPLPPRPCAPGLTPRPHHAGS